jgi:hypothetical protein
METIILLLLRIHLSGKCGSQVLVHTDVLSQSDIRNKLHIHMRESPESFREMPSVCKYDPPSGMNEKLIDRAATA